MARETKNHLFKFFERGITTWNSGSQPASMKRRRGLEGQDLYARLTEVKPKFWKSFCEPSLLQISVIRLQDRALGEDVTKQ